MSVTGKIEVKWLLTKYRPPWLHDHRDLKKTDGEKKAVKRQMICFVLGLYVTSERQTALQMKNVHYERASIPPVDLLRGRKYHSAAEKKERFVWLLESPM